MFIRVVPAFLIYCEWSRFYHPKRWRISREKLRKLGTSYFGVNLISIRSLLVHKQSMQQFIADYVTVECNVRVLSCWVFLSFFVSFFRSFFLSKSRNRKSHYPLSEMNCMSARKTNVLFCSMYAFTHTTIKSCVVTMTILLNFVTLFISIPLHSHTHVVIKRSVIHSCQSEPQDFTSSNCKKCDYSVV